MSLRYEYRFHPVGQGLFSSHVIYEGNRSRFWWVYDCGTSSPFGKLRTEIEALRKEVDEETLSGKIDLVFISHFDEDHINGLVLLLENFQIDTLVLPYIPQWQRLVIALEQGVSLREEVIGFYINPVAYLASVAPERIERVLFVPPRDDGDPVDISSLVEPIVPRPGDWQPRYKTFANEHYDKENGTGPDNEITVEYLNPWEPITVAGLWEFIPYNDHKKFTPSKANLRRKIERSLRTMLPAVPIGAKFDPLAIENAISQIKRDYLEQFGSTAYQRNTISLMLYSGEISPPSVHNPIPAEYIFETNGTLNTISEIERKRGALLLTGDGYLKSRKQLAALLQILDNRASRLGVMQVMHHGSRLNWHRGVAAALRPLCAVFASEPRHYGHPHPEVVTDFIESQFAPVTETRHFRFTGFID